MSNIIYNEQLWKVIPGCPCYEVHPDGVIRNAITGELVKQRAAGGESDKYMLCNLRDADGNWKTGVVHRIVATVFIDTPEIDGEDDWQVDHIDYNPSNNSVRNLRWLPAKLNQVLRRNVRPEVARRKILEYYREHDIDYDYFNLLSEL